jgi:hypothetical protein
MSANDVKPPSSSVGFWDYISGEVLLWVCAALLFPFVIPERLWVHAYGISAILAGFFYFRRELKAASVRQMQRLLALVRKG